MTGSLDEWVQTGRLDVALLYDHKAFEDIVASEVMIEELMLIVAAGHPLAGARAVKFADLAGLSIVLPARPHVIRGVVEQTGARASLPVDVAVNCDSLAGIVQLVRHGHATLFPSFAMSEEIARGEFVAVPVIHPTPSWRLSIVLSKKSSNPPLQQGDRDADGRCRPQHGAERQLGRAAKAAEAQRRAMK